MALASSFIVKRTFLELAEELQLPRARFSTDSFLSTSKVDDMDRSCSPKLSDMEGGPSTDSGTETESPSSRWADDSEDELDARTTVMLQGLNLRMDRDELLVALNASRFRGRFDFIYVPCDFNTWQPQGFGFINFARHVDAEQFRLQPPASLGADARTLWSDKEQGLAENVGRYRNSPVMHPTVPERSRPSLVHMDSLVALPHPTRQIKAPKVKRALCRAT